MVTKIIANLKGKQNNKTRIVSLIGKEIIHTKYQDIGQAKKALAGLREMEKQSSDLKVIDKTRGGVVVEEHSGKTEKQLVAISLKQVKDVIKGLNQDTPGGLKSKIEVFEEKNGEWIKK